MGAGETERFGPSPSWLWDPARQCASQATAAAISLFPHSFSAPDASLGPDDPVAALSNACWAAQVSAGRAELGPITFERWRLTCRSSLTPLQDGGAGLQVEITGCAALERDGRATDNRLARTAHDLRAPLTSIVGFAEFIAASGAAMTEEARRSYAADIAEAGRFASRMVDDLLSYATAAEIAATRREVVDLAEIAQRAARTMAPEAEARNVTLSAENDAESAGIRGAEDQIRRAAANLLGNAIAHADHRVIIRLRRSDGAITLSIEDDGPGLSAHELALALTPFGRPTRSDDPEAKGVGLGLPIAQRFVTANGGRLTIESAPGEGFAAHMIFPIEGAD